MAWVEGFLKCVRLTFEITVPVKGIAAVTAAHLSLFSKLNSRSIFFDKAILGPFQTPC